MVIQPSFFLFKFDHLADGTVLVEVFAGRTRAKRGKCGRLKMRASEWDVLERVLGSSNADIEIVDACEHERKKSRRDRG